MKIAEDHGICRVPVPLGLAKKVAKLAWTEYTASLASHQNPREISRTAKLYADIAMTLSKELMWAGQFKQSIAAADRGMDAIAVAGRWASVRDMRGPTAAKKLRGLAKGEDKEDAKDVRDIAALIERGKLGDAYKKYRSLDTFVRDLFPDAVVDWLAFMTEEETTR